MLTINSDRFLRTLAELGEIGRVPEAEGGGLDRRPFSPAERAARDYFTREAEAAGLTVRTDAAATLSARLACAPDEDAPTLLLGSHLDTVPHGGPYDGALGVLAALETLRVVRENGVSLPWHLEAVAFTDEEGRLGDFFGSRAAAGAHTSESIEAFLAAAAAYPEDLAAMRARVPGDLTPDAILTARRDPSHLAGYLELHIEQGPVLERAGVPIGVVTAIAGRRSMQVVFRGRSDHAGTTPLDMRADALLAAARFIVQARDWIHANHPRAVLTCGNVRVQPGVYNVVANEAVVWVEFRAADKDTLAAIDRQIQGLVGRPQPPGGGQNRSGDRGLGGPLLEITEVMGEIIPGDAHDPVMMDSTLQNAIRRAANKIGCAHMDLPSGALHDAQIMASITPAAMIFVPSMGGRSHSPLEMTAPDDLIAGANVLLQAVLVLAEDRGSKNG